MSEIGIRIDIFNSRIGELKSGFKHTFFGDDSLGMPSGFETTYPGAERALEILMRIEKVMDTYHEVLVRDIETIQRAAERLAEAENEIANNINQSSIS